MGLAALTLLLIGTCAVQAGEDPLPPGARWRQGATRLRHASGINALTYSPDGKFVASGGYDGAVRLWDTSDGKEVAFFYATAFESRIYHLAFSPNGRILAAGTGSGIFLFDIDKRRLHRHFEGEALRVSFAADGRRIAGSGTSATLWDIDSGTKLQTTPADNRCIYGLGIAPDGNELLYAHCDAYNKPGATDVICWDIATRREARRLPGPKRDIDGLHFSPDKHTLAVAAQEEVILFDTRQWKQRGRIATTARDVAFCPKTGQLFVGATDAVHIYNPATGALERKLAQQPSDLRRRVAVSPDGRTLATSGSEGRIRLWNIADGRELLPQPDPVDHVIALAFSPDGRTVASRSADGRAQLWDAATGQPGKLLTGYNEYRLRFDNAAASLVFSNDARVLAGSDPNGTIRLWDVASGKQLRRWQPETRVSALALTPDGRIIVTGSPVGLERWNAETGNRLGDLERPYPPNKFLAVGLGSPALSPDGKYVAASVYPHEPMFGGVRFGNEPREPIPPSHIQIWETATGKVRSGPRLIDATAGASGPVIFGDGSILFVRTVLAGAPHTLFLGDGTTLASAGDPILLWDVGSGRISRRFVHPKDSSSGAIAVSRDGRWLAAALVVHGQKGTPQAKQHLVCLWETASGKVALTRTGHRGAITTLTFAPDAKTLVSGGHDANILMWDLSPLRLDEPAKALLDEAIDSLWKGLASADAAVAYRAVHVLAAHPDEAVKLLTARLRPDPPLPVAQWIDDLQADRFAKRDQAQRQLAGLGREAVSHLLAVDGDKLTLEGQRRRQRLLQSLAETPWTAEQLRQLRAVDVLERIGRPAEALLKRLGEGRESAPQTDEARAALRRRR